jgi:uncharacterized membrane protein
MQLGDLWFTSCAVALAQAATEAPATGLPPIDAQYVAGLLSRVAHIASAIILGGGLFYLRTVLAPAGADACYADRRAVWAKWVHLAIVLLLASGIYNFLAINSAAKAAGGKLPAVYHALFGIKFLLGLLVMFVASILAGRTAAADRFRQKIRLWLHVGWGAVLAIVVVAAIMRSLH